MPMRDTPAFESHSYAMSADKMIDGAIAKARLIKRNPDRERIIAQLFIARAHLHAAMVELKHLVSVEGYKTGGD